MVYGGGGRGGEFRLPYATLHFSMVPLPLHSTTMTALGKELNISMDKGFKVTNLRDFENFKIKRAIMI